MSQFVENVVSDVQDTLASAITAAVKRQLSKMTVPDVLELLSDVGTEGGKGKGKSKGKEEATAPKKRGRPAKNAAEAKAPPVNGIKKNLKEAKAKSKGRRSSDEINNQISSVIKLLTATPDGMAVGDIAKKLKCESEDLTRAMHLALKDELISKQGEKRNTRYFPVDGAEEKFAAKLKAAKEAPSSDEAPTQKGDDAEENLDASALNGDGDGDGEAPSIEA